MKILHIGLSLSPRCGGPSVAVTEMTRHQVLKGLDVTVYSTNMDYPSGILDVPINAPVMNHGVRHHYFTVQFTPLLVSLPMAIELRKTIRNYDLLHIHALYRFPTTYAASLCRKYNIPYIVEPHGSLDPYLHKQSAYSVWAKRAYEKMFDLPNLNAASTIRYSSSEEMAKCDFLDLRAPGVVVPHGLDWNRFKRLPSKGGLRKRLGLNDEPLILFLGRINFKKGLDLLVQAFYEVVEVLDDAVLVIVGPDNNGYAKVVRKWIAARGLSDKVYWQEMLYDDEVLEAYVDADVFVLPSYTENFGLAVVEAMACALPVVISDQVNISSDVSQSAAGMVVRLNGQEIARTIITVLEDKNLATRMGHAGRKLAQDMYAYDHIIDKLTEVYKTIIKAHSSINA